MKRPVISFNRKLEKTFEINDISDIESAMELIAYCDKEISNIDNMFAKEIDKLTKEKEKRMADYVAVYDHVEECVKEFTKLNKDKMFTEEKTYYTPYGKISMRLTPPSVEFVESEEATIKKIKRNFFKRIFDSKFREAIRVKYSVVKTVVRELDEKTLKKLGIKINQSEVINIDV